MYWYDSAVIIEINAVSIEISCYFLLVILHSLNIVLCVAKFDPIVCALDELLEGFNLIVLPDEVPCPKEFEPILVCPLDE